MGRLQLNWRFYWRIHLLRSTLIFLLSLMLSAFGVAHGAPSTGEIRLATTTSTEASGLLAVILPKFEAASGIRVRAISVGTGQALKLGERGDVDVVLVHSRPDEDKFMLQGFGSARYDVMYNDFVIVGPKSDPAKIMGLKNASEALKKIAQSQSRFVSRGDDSGTHKKELAIWKSVAMPSDGVKPNGKWYVEAGQGMGEVLTMAANMNAYTLADRGTYLAYRGKTNLDVLVSQVPGLYNPYGVMVVNVKKHPHVRHEAALAFANWLTSLAGQEAIRSLKVDGQLLFVPGAPPIE